MQSSACQNASSTFLSSIHHSACDTCGPNIGKHTIALRALYYVIMTFVTQHLSVRQISRNILSDILYMHTCM